MQIKSLMLASLVALSVAWMVQAQSAPPARPAAPGAQAPAPAAPQPRQPAAPAVRPVSTPTAPAASSVTLDDGRAFIKQYCVTCHNQAARAAMDSSRKLALDTLDLANMDRDRDKWELVVRKVRAGMMPPTGMRRPEPERFDALISWMENELDRTGKPFTPPPGLHRLNRTEYANVVRDLLDLDIDPGKYLPSDDSTSGFDNIAGALGISSTLVEAYVGASQKISRLALGYPEEPTLAVYRTREDTSQDYHIEGLPFGTRGGMLVKHVFPSDGEYTLTVTPIFGDNMSPTGFGSVPCERIEMLLDGERLGLMDWVGGGRNTPGNCPGRPRRRRWGRRGPRRSSAGAAARRCG
jgi:mono/diheme cytochrome c family protein